MCKFIGKSNERILCKLSKSEILRLYSIVHVAMETIKRSNHQYIFQLVSGNLSLAIIWQMTYTHKLPKLCSATLRVYIDISKCLGYIRTIQDSFCAVTKSYRIVVCYTPVFSVVTQQRHVA